ncbi:tautomerase family protein [Granulicella sp. L46]|uniref:tautomerase family protein n=1 Tax=Granulicella sp. L46 TaxID=1641865 RepID=UPI00131D780D|nr:tautomerase family protein [Granulicella sp. L46]
MPIMHVYYPQGALDAQRKHALGQKLTDVLITMEGGAGTHAGRAFATVMLAEISADNWFVGGHLDSTFVAKAGKFLVYVTIPEGYMNAAHKTEVHAWVNSAILEVTGYASEPDAGASVLVVINEVPEGNWGASGKTIGLGSIAQSVGLPKDGDRFRWIESYFAAKQRGLRMAGYPEDMGGLISIPQ